MKTNKFWALVFIAIICVCAGIMLRMSTGAPKNGDTARIYSNGRLIRSIDLTAVKEPFSLTVWADGGESGDGGESSDGGDGHGEFNVIEVENGRIRVADADCKDGICRRQGWRSGGITPIVCFPHRLVIELDSGTDESRDTQVDGVVG